MKNKAQKRYVKSVKIVDETKKYMLKYLAIQIFVCLLTNTKLVLSQEQRSFFDFGFYKPETMVYFLGERHGMSENYLLQRDVFKYMAKVTKKKQFTVFLEYPFVFTNLLNNAISRKDSDLDEFMNVFYSSKRNNSYVEQFIGKIDNLQYINDSILEPNGKILVVYAFDDFHVSYDFCRNLKVLSTFFPYIRNEVESHCSSCYRVRKNNHKFIKKLINDLNSGYFKTIDSVGLMNLGACLGHIENKFFINPRHHILSLDRENFMADMIFWNLNLNCVNIVICGGDHAIYSDKEIWYDKFYKVNFSPMATIISQLNQNLTTVSYDNWAVTIWIEYLKNRNFRKLTKQNRQIINENDKYIILKNHELFKPYINLTADYGIVINKKR